MPTSMIDAHHHCWRYVPAEYPWIDDSLAMLRRDFLFPEFERELVAAGVSGCIAVQARQTVAETRWLLDLAREHDRIVGVVGWLPLADPRVGEMIDALSASRSSQEHAGSTSRRGLVGIRHVLHDEADADFLLRPDIDAGIAHLASRDLAYDLLVRERELPAALTCANRHPGQRFIVDHAAKPRIAQHALEPWRTRMRALARLPNVWCKLSGLVTEADQHAWTEDDLRPYVLEVLEAFGPKRVMFASDWPVCLGATTYRGWIDTVSRLTATLSASERDAVMGGAAHSAYRLG